MIRPSDIHRRQDQLRRRLHERQARRHQEEERRREDKETNEARQIADFTDAAAVAVVATARQRRAFAARLEAHETVTIQALLQNERALAIVREKLTALLAQAHVLPDGRRVFRTKDGKRVFDEEGNEVGADIIDPEVISEGRPTWEDFQEVQEEEDRLAIEREDLLEHQEKLDDARERLEDDDLTADELEDLRRELESSAPAAVRDQLNPQPSTNGHRSAPATPGSAGGSPLGYGKQ